jgi:hypothetical protein
MGRRWRPEDVFALSDLATLAKVRNDRGEWIGIYQGPSGPLVDASRSPRVLARRLKHAGLSWPVHARRAPSKGELPVNIEPDKPDHFMVQMQQAYAAVGRAWHVVRNSIGVYSEVEVKRARDFLHGLGNACRSEGKSRGDKAHADENQEMLKVFAELAEGKTLKQIAIDLAGSDNYEKKLRSLSVLTKRFSRKVYTEICSQYGRVSEGLLLRDKSWGYLSSFFGSIKKWPGVMSNCREHGSALCEALSCYKPTGDELRQFRRPRGHLVQSSPKLHR